MGHRSWIVPATSLRSLRRVDPIKSTGNLALGIEAAYDLLRIMMEDHESGIKE
jgi:hypothetical protein